MAEGRGAGVSQEQPGALRISWGKHLWSGGTCAPADFLGCTWSGGRFCALRISWGWHCSGSERLWLRPVVHPAGQLGAFSVSWWRDGERRQKVQPRDSARGVPRVSAELSLAAEVSGNEPSAPITRTSDRISENEGRSPRACSVGRPAVMHRGLACSRVSASAHAVSLLSPACFPS